MAKTKISEFSSTPANNTDIDSINIAEGCAPSGINDAIRELMAQLKDFQTGAQGDSFNGPIGTSTAAAGAFTTLSATGAITSTLATGSAPLVIASTTKVSNLNVDLLDGADWASPAALGSTTPAAVSATTLSASSTVTLSGGTANGVAYLNGSKVVTSGSALTFDGTNLGLKTSSGSNIFLDSTTTGTSNSFTSLLNNANAFAPLNYIALSHTWKYGATTLASVDSNGTYIWYPLGSEQMRLTSTGLGIGTSSPAVKLDVAGAIRSNVSGGTPIFYLNNGSTQHSISNSSGAMPFAIDGSEKMRLDSSGNLGLGVTPSAWVIGGSASALQVKNASFYGDGASGIYSSNAFFSTSWKYISTATASQYEQSGGAHKWYNAPSGTAGNAITFSQAMTLTADGALALGTTSPSAKLHVSNGGAGGLEFNPTSGYLGGAYIQGYNRSTSAFIPVEVIASSFGVVLGSTQALTVDSSGNFLIGATSTLGVAKALLSWSGGSNNGLCLNNSSGSGTPNHINFMWASSSVGSVTCTASSTAYNTSSDYRLKNTIAPMTGALAKVALLKPCTYKWNADGSDGEGFIAHELAEVCPHAVTGEKDAVDEEGNPKYQGIDTSFLVATLTAAIQELKAEFDAYKASHP